MTDDYFIEKDAAAEQGGGAGTAVGGSNSTGGSGGSGAISTGGTAVTGGAAGQSGGSSGSGGGPPTGGWTTTSPPPGSFSPREKAAYTSIGSQLFIWGGVNESGTALNSGALYDPRTDSWRAVANDATTPTPRSLATAVWTGSRVVVWGGLDPVTMQPLADGAIYDPVEDAWLPMSPGLRARTAAVGVSSDSGILFFGGQNASGPIGGLDEYRPATDTWRAGMTGSPPAAADPATAGGALTFWAYGGRTTANTGVANTSYWSMSSARWVPSAALTPGRWGSFAAFAYATFFVWGGRDLNGSFGDGSGYRIATARWNAMSGASAPSPRYVVERESGWAFAVDPEGLTPSVVIIAGLDAPGSYLADGAVYDTNGDTWAGIPAWPSASSHAFGAAGIAAGEVVVWGGRDGATLTNEGVRYALPD